MSSKQFQARNPFIIVGRVIETLLVLFMSKTLIGLYLEDVKNTWIHMILAWFITLGIEFQISKIKKDAKEAIEAAQTYQRDTSPKSIWEKSHPSYGWIALATFLLFLYLIFWIIKMDSLSG